MTRPVSLDPVSATPVAPTVERPGSEGQRLKQAAEAFEALLVQTMLKAMRQAQLQDGLFGEGPGASVYEGLFDERMSERLSEDSPFGVARMLEEQWKSGRDADRLAREALKAIEAEQGRRRYDEAAAAGVPPGSASAVPPPSTGRAPAK